MKIRQHVYLTWHCNYSKRVLICLRGKSRECQHSKLKRLTTVVLVFSYRRLQQNKNLNNSYFLSIIGQFQDDVLVGATAIGLTEHIGVLRGLIEGRVKLGEWKDRLLREPMLVMDAYLACAQAAA